MISLDTETTGVDFFHDTRPFLVTTCDDAGEQSWWEWNVNPTTRMPQIPKGDLREIREVVESVDYIVMQNSKFDVRALETIGITIPWEKVHDTLLAGHLLASSEPHSLTAMSIKYLRYDISRYEERLRKEINRARDRARRHLPDWKIAKKGTEGMPSATAEPWKFDLWLPRAICLRQKDLLPDTVDWSAKKDKINDHLWQTVCAEYANADSAVTLPLFRIQEKMLKDKDLWGIYLERLKVLPVVYEMEKIGVTLNSNRLAHLQKEFIHKSESCSRVCVNVAASFGCNLEMPRSGANDSMRHAMFSAMKMPVVKTSKRTGDPSLDKEALDELETRFSDNSRESLFVRRLKQKRKRDTAVLYMDGYRRFWVPCHDWNDEWFRLHPSLNLTGTNTLRCSSSNPNSQNISKQEGFNLRYPFGPVPGREWWSLDAKNIELRIPAYEADETEMIALFEREDDPPYFGSHHLLVFSVLHPEKFAQHGADCKKVFASSWYQWTKNGNFAVQYGAVEESGTADRAYHVKGAQRRIQQRFNKVAKLNERMIDHADKRGYVETIPDKTVNPKRGYPLQCPLTKYGQVKPTIPLNYHVQGTAMWWMCSAMVKVANLLEQINLVQEPERQYHVIMQVHDELVIDCPAAPDSWQGNPQDYNRDKITAIQRTMESCGDDIGIPTPVGVDYHPHTWSESV